MTGPSPQIVAFGDLMLQLTYDEHLPDSDQRSAIIDWSGAELGGAVWNVAWYMHFFDRTTHIAGHYGPDAASQLAALPGASAFDHGALLRSASTDRLLMFKQGGLPSLYLMEPLLDRESDILCGNLAGVEVVVFAGTRHVALRDKYRRTMASLTPRMVVFSPSYSAYEYGRDELEQFLTHADLTFVNHHEAKHLCDMFDVADPGKLMRRSRLGGVVTRAAAGATLYPRNGLDIDLPSTSGVDTNVVGAGEAFMCGFIEGFLQTGNFLRAGHLGIAVSAQTARAGDICSRIDPLRAKAEAGIGQSAPKTN